MLPGSKPVEKMSKLEKTEGGKEIPEGYDHGPKVSTARPGQARPARLVAFSFPLMEWYAEIDLLLSSLFACNW